MKIPDYILHKNTWKQAKINYLELRETLNSNLVKVSYKVFYKMKSFFTLVFILSISSLIFSEDDSLGDFGFDDEESGTESSVFSIDFGGAFYAGTEVFFDAFKSPKTLNHPSLFGAASI